MSALSRIFGEAVLALLLMYGASSSAEGAPGGLQISIATDPSPLRVGTDRVEVTVRTPGGQLVDNAVVRILTSMPVLQMSSPMPMQGMGRAAETLVARAKGSGRYAAAIHVPKATQWRIVVHAASNGTMGTAYLDATVR